MTDWQFKTYLKKQYRFQIIINYLICILMLLGAVIVLNDFFKQLTPTHMGSFSLYAGIFLLAIVSYGLWRIPKDYRVIKIASHFSVEQKKQLAEAYMVLVEGQLLTNEENILKFQYTNKYWNTVDVHITFDDDFFLLNASTGNRPGIVDFGLAKRAQQKIAAYFKGRCLTMVCSNDAIVPNVVPQKT